MKNPRNSAKVTTKTGQHRMISPDEALELVLKEAKPLLAERRPILEAYGCILDEPICADRDQPPFDRAMMDGYAVPEGAAGKKLTVVDLVPAGQVATSNLIEGHCVEIMTGAPCPECTEAVVPKEHVKVDENEVDFPKLIVPGQHIVTRGSECRSGEVVIKADTRIDALAVAVLSSFGKESVSVISSPSLAIITTGAEVVPPESLPGPSQIRDGNGPMLCAMAESLGVGRPECAHAFDQMDSIIDNLKRFADHDLLILTGGVSVGRFDLVPEALKQQGAEVIFHRVRQKPGKPLLFARRGDQLIFGLPGNPLACHFCFHRYVAPTVRRMQGHNPDRVISRGRLAESIQPRRGRAHFVLGKVGEVADSDGVTSIRPMPGKSSGDVFYAVAPNCYLKIPAGSEVIPAGELIDFTWLDGI